MLKLHDETVRFHFDLEEAAGNRLVLEIGVLGGSAPVLLGAVDQVVPDSFSDLIFVVVDTLRADRILDPEDALQLHGSIDLLRRACTSLAPIATRI